MADAGASPEAELPLALQNFSIGPCASRALVQPNETSSTISVSASIADIARRIPDAADREKLMAVANVLDETVVALPRNDDREDWVREEEIPRSTDALGRERMVKALGLETRAGAVQTDWTDVNEALRMHAMMRSFAPHDEDGKPVDRLALKASVIRAIEHGDRIDSNGADIPAILADIREKYTPMLMAGKPAAALGAGSASPPRADEKDGNLLAVEAALELNERAEIRALAALKAIL
jgi:hypothetical protein